MEDPLKLEEPKRYHMVGLKDIIFVNVNVITFNFDQNQIHHSNHPHPRHILAQFWTSDQCDIKHRLNQRIVTLPYPV